MYSTSQATLKLRNGQSSQVHTISPQISDGSSNRLSSRNFGQPAIYTNSIITQREIVHAKSKLALIDTILKDIRHCDVSADEQEKVVSLLKSLRYIKKQQNEIINRSTHIKSMLDYNVQELCSAQTLLKLHKFILSKYPPESPEYQTHYPEVYGNGSWELQIMIHKKAIQKISPIVIAALEKAEMINKIIEDFNIVAKALNIDPEDLETANENLQIILTRQFTILDNPPELGSMDEINYLEQEIEDCKSIIDAHRFILESGIFHPQSEIYTFHNHQVNDPQESWSVQIDIYQRQLKRKTRLLTSENMFAMQNLTTQYQSSSVIQDVQPQAFSRKDSYRPSKPVKTGSMSLNNNIIEKIKSTQSSIDEISRREQGKYKSLDKHDKAEKIRLEIEIISNIKQLKSALEIKREEAKRNRDLDKFISISKKMFELDLQMIPSIDVLQKDVINEDKELLNEIDKYVTAALNAYKTNADAFNPGMKNAVEVMFRSSLSNSTNIAGTALVALSKTGVFLELAGGANFAPGLKLVTSLLNSIALKYATNKYHEKITGISDFTADFDEDYAEIKSTSKRACVFLIKQLIDSIKYKSEISNLESIINLEKELQRMPKSDKNYDKLQLKLSRLNRLDINNNYILNQLTSFLKVCDKQNKQSTSDRATNGLKRTFSRSKENLKAQQDMDFLRHYSFIVASDMLDRMREKVNEPNYDKTDNITCIEYATRKFVDTLSSQNQEFSDSSSYKYESYFQPKFTNNVIAYGDAKARK